MENLLKELHDIICQLEGSPASKRKKQLVKLRILNECKDCVGAWVLQITGTGVGTLSEDRIYSQSNLCLPHIAKQTFGRRGRTYYLLT